MGLNNHSVFISEDGTVKSVGLNNYGQLGIGNTDNQSTLQDVPISNVKQVSCGQYHTTFLLEDGTVKSVGRNNDGQLGIGNTNNQSTLQDVPITNVKQVSCGYYHTIFLLEDGTVKSVGQNNYGQLGIGNTSTREVQLQDVPISNVKQVSCGQYYTTFLLEDGTVKSVGRNLEGQLGIGNTSTQELQLQNVPISNVKQVSCGQYHTTFLLEDGTVKSVGQNNNGQLGIGNTSNQSTLQDVPISNVKQVSCGQYHTTFLLEDGTVKSVGLNNNGQLGIGNTIDQSTLQDVPISNVKQVSCGGYHTTFLLEDGTVKSVGLNTNGQLGIGNTSTREVQLQDVPISSVESLWGMIDLITFLVKKLYYHASKYKVFREGSWAELQGEPTITDFKDVGMDIGEEVPSEHLNSLSGTVEEVVWTDEPLEDIYEDNDDQLRYRVQVNDKVKKDWTTFTSRPLIINEELHYTDFNVGSNTVTLEYSDELGAVGSKTYNVTRINYAPRVEDVVADPISIHREDVVITGKLVDNESDKITYRILLNGEVFKDWSEPSTAPVEMSFAIPNSDLNLGANVVRVEVKDEFNTGSTTIDINKVDMEPVLTYDFQGLTLQATITDENSDRVKYRVLINGVQRLPVENGFTDWMETPTTVLKTFPSDYVKIGENNTLTIEVMDDFSNSVITETISFVGDYSGLMFEDMEGNYYSSDKGDVLQYLEFGTVVAGSSTEPQPVNLRNKNGFSVRNIRLTKVEKTLPDKVTVELSKEETPFVPRESITYNRTLKFNEHVTFFVRINAPEDASPGSGEFDINVKADPI